jgi:integrase/recombinase XerC
LACDIITGIATATGLDDDTTAHVVRHTFATTLLRGGTDLVIVAELLGHRRLETTRGYTRPTAEDRTRALDLLLVDECGGDYEGNHPRTHLIEAPGPS